MKRLLPIICALLAALLLVGAAAEEPEPTCIRLAPGESIQLTLKLTATAAGMQARVEWDPERLELTGDAPAFAADFKKGAMIAMINPEPEVGAITLVYLRQSDLAAQDAEVLSLEFRVCDQAVSGPAGIAVTGLQLVDAQNAAVDAVAEGLTVEIVSDVPALEATATPEPTEVPEATAEPTATIQPAARLYLEPVTPEPTIEPTAEPTTAPTATPLPTNVPPSGSISGGSGGSSATATPAPTATPEPTVGSVVIGTPAPAAGSDCITLTARAENGAVVVELVAKNVQIGGLQAEIVYDAATAQLLSAAFSDAFLEGSMIQMVNDGQPGRISLVYTNLSGYQADGSAIFTARFLCENAEEAAFALEGTKYTGADASLSAVEVADQQVLCVIQPMDDLTVVEEDGLRIVEVAEGGSFSLTVDPGEVVALRVQGREIPAVLWSSDRDEVVAITPEGLMEAQSSGLANLTARSADGALLAEGRICVRNAQFGLPVEILSITVSDGVGDTFALAADADEEAWLARGIALTFRDGETSLRVEGLLPEDMTALPAGAFDLCGTLVEVDLAARNVLTIESGAFLNCPSIETIILRSPVVELLPDALPAAGCALRVPADSVAAQWAEAQGLAAGILEEAGDAQ